MVHQFNWIQVNSATRCGPGILFSRFISSHHRLLYRQHLNIDPDVERGNAKMEATDSDVDEREAGESSQTSHARRIWKASRLRLNEPHPDALAYAYRLCLPRRSSASPCTLLFLLVIKYVHWFALRPADLELIRYMTRNNHMYG